MTDHALETLIDDAELTDVRIESGTGPTMPGGTGVPDDPGPLAITRRAEIVFIDTGVEGWEDLLTGVAPGTEVVEIAPDEDGLARMAEVLADRADLDAVHVISHGGVGRVYLGTATLSGATLEEYAEDLTRIGAALCPDGDLLLYGCEVGADDAGRAFVDRLATLTGADVAASDDPTGAAGLGGDWDLEVTTGAIEATPWAKAGVEGFGGSVATTWMHTLGTYVPGRAAEGTLSGSDTGYVSSGSDFGGTAAFLVKEASGTFELYSTDSKGSGSALYIEDFGNKQTSGALFIKVNDTTLGSFDVSDIRILGNYDDSTVTITVTGYLAGGGTVSSGQTSSTGESHLAEGSGKGGRSGFYRGLPCSEWEAPCPGFWTRFPTSAILGRPMPAMIFLMF